MKVMGKNYRPGTFDAPYIYDEHEVGPFCHYCGDEEVHYEDNSNYFCEDCIDANYQEHLRDVEPSERPTFEEWLDEENLNEL